MWSKASLLADHNSSVVIKDRTKRLKDLEKHLAYEYKKIFLGKKVSTLVESFKNGKFEGTTDRYMKVEFKSDKFLKFSDKNKFIKNIVDVKINDIFNEKLCGIFY